VSLDVLHDRPLSAIELVKDAQLFQLTYRDVYIGLIAPPTAGVRPRASHAPLALFHTMPRSRSGSTVPLKFPTAQQMHFLISDFGSSPISKSLSLDATDDAVLPARYLASYDAGRLSPHLSDAVESRSGVRPRRGRSRRSCPRIVPAASQSLAFLVDVV
jgi:hypothetical protein